MICPNCKTKHGCGCQAKKASNGASVCTTCITSYEHNLTILRNGPDPTAPTNVKIMYNPNK